MPWIVAFHPDMQPEFDGLAVAVQAVLLVQVEKLRAGGPTLGRPTVDTLTSSRVANLKELRFTADGGVWRVAFAFDGQRIAVLLVAGNKAGVAQTRFYKGLIAVAEQRWRTWT